MPGLVPGIHVLAMFTVSNAVMAGSSPAVTKEVYQAGLPRAAASGQAPFYSAASRMVLPSVLSTTTGVSKKLISGAAP